LSPLPIDEETARVALEVVVATAPAGQPVKSPEVDTQIVLVPAHCVSGLVTVIVVLVATVLVPSYAERLTV
jgi:hypothetical protein